MLFLVWQFNSQKWMQRTIIYNNPQQSIPTGNITRAKDTISKMYKPICFKYFYLHCDKLRSNGKMLTFKERVNKTPEGLTRSKDIVQMDDC